MSRYDDFIAELFRQYDRITLPVFGSIAAQDKADGSSITSADRDASAHVLEYLMRYTPDYGVISEEESEPYRPGADWQWVVDPLDGTAAFARGLPVWGIGIGLLYKGEPREGYLYFPVLKETYAFRDGIGLLNGKRITRPSTPVAKDCRNIMITSVHSYVDVRRLSGLRIHNLGSNLYHLIALATSRCEAICTGPCGVWDLAPALPFTRALGHVERFLDGSPLSVPELMRRGDFRLPADQPLLIGPSDQVETLIGAFASGHEGGGSRARSIG